jgi:hypothetical protein
MKKLLALSILVLTAFTTGCSLNHPVAKDYSAHLEKYGSETTLSKTNLETDYEIDPSTEEHRYEFRAATVGYAHLWIVEFGKILDQTLNAKYVQSAFGKLQKGEGANGNLVEFELVKYEFKDYRAYTDLNIKVTNAGNEVFNKTYHAEGDSQGGQMWMAGPFGMKNATLKSTKSSIDKILEQFITDINASDVVAK